MTQQIINQVSPGDGLGDPLFTAFQKTNANFTELYTGAGVYYARTAAEIAAGVTPTNYGYAPGNVLRYGADPSGVADSTTAFQSAINGLAITGGTVSVPAGVYLISSTVTIGNGSSTAASTRYGIFIIGQAAPTAPFAWAGGYGSTAGVQINWGGSAGQDVFKVQGPLQGWGIQNILVNGNAGASFNAASGLSVISAQFGDCRNLTFVGCEYGIYSKVVSAIPAGLTNIDSLHNRYKGIAAYLPNISASYGIVMTGTTSGNSDYADFDDLTICFTGSSTTEYGIYLQAADNCRFRNVQFVDQNTQTSCIVFDYTVNNVWPADCIIDTVDFGANGVIANDGSPGTGATFNRILHVSSTNGLTPNPALANLLWETNAPAVETAPPRALATVYQNTSGRNMSLQVSVTASSPSAFQLICDTNSSPVTVVNEADNNIGSSTKLGLTCVVPVGYYYKVVNAGGSVNSWVETYL